MGRTQFAAAAALAVGAALITAPASVAAVGDAVVYTVTSDAPLAVVSYYDATGVLQRVTNQPVPWSLSFTNKDASPTSLLVVTANPTGQKTTCTVSVNGTVKDTQSKTGAGEDNMVQCSTMGNP
ncbi:MmpS family transport accessory protein [Mycobacterium sp. Aquia_213]|uniref:MmpS family transport accessory protein n=1 Tax=Mycobacterium sp. Aquia_213 TaxID=2991728 RepID=UPI00226DEC79|nr:MmpS family transport accessory protein [Mycobacterium sp. Aquia_213]WAC93119.1 MmpS family transport accessory protein [Mycobacterium sp. Aquia_213]